MPETAAGRRLAAEVGAAYRIDIIRAIEAEARALGRAEALAAVRAALVPMQESADRNDAWWLGNWAEDHIADVLAAIDNLETS